MGVVRVHTVYGKQGNQGKNDQGKVRELFIFNKAREKSGYFFVRWFANSINCDPINYSGRLIIYSVVNQLIPV